MARIGGDRPERQVAHQRVLLLLAQAKLAPKALRHRLGLHPTILLDQDLQRSLAQRIAGHHPPRGGPQREQVVVGQGAVNEKATATRECRGSKLEPVTHDPGRNDEQKRAHDQRCAPPAVSPQDQHTGDQRRYDK